MMMMMMASRWYTLIPDCFCSNISRFFLVIFVWINYRCRPRDPIVIIPICYMYSVKPEHLRQTNTINLFKRTLKTFLFALKTFCLIGYISLLFYLLTYWHDWAGIRTNLRPMSLVCQTITSQFIGRQWTRTCWAVSTTRLRCQCSAISQMDASSRLVIRTVHSQNSSTMWRNVKWWHWHRIRGFV